VWILHAVPFGFGSSEIKFKQFGALDLPAWNLQKPDSDTDPSRAPTRANQFEVPVNNLFRSGDNTLPPVLKHDTTQSLDLLFDLFTTSKQPSFTHSSQPINSFCICCSII
jgi:hypothetical protein